MSSPTRKFTIALLLIGISACLALLPWGTWFGKSFDEKLTDRVAEYVRLRIQDDWVGIYAMTDAKDRRVVPIQRFLTLYGSGAIRTVSLTETARQIDAAAGTAQVDMTLDGELQIDKLPPQARATLRLQDPTATRQSGPASFQWVLRDGEWWLRMDREALTGRTADGKPITATGG
ncbi:MAG: hypothetical protein JNM25_05530 [Planctomycetes bacterium]|nr:hypothetical protein [Planctomycetota bacterium]